MALLRPAALVVALLLVTPAYAGRVGTGDRVPDLALSDWQGRPTRLAAFGGRVVVLDFWASWCGRCKDALPRLDALARRHSDARLAVVAVNVDASRTTADRFLAEHLPHPALTLLHDPDGGALARFGAGGMPALYLLDRDGVVRAVEAGYAPERLDAVERAVDDLLRDGGASQAAVAP